LEKVISFKTICIVGLGYIGLPTAAMFASRGLQVVGLDVSQAVVDKINSGKVHIVEDELDDLVELVVKKGKLEASTIAKPADAFLICVPTPFIDHDSHKPDLSFVKAACEAIAPCLKRGDLVILESTSPVGTTERLESWLASLRPDLSFPSEAREGSNIRIAYCPERVMPGNVVQELVSNDRIIGGLTQRCSNYAADLYKIFVRGDCLLTDSRTAEMTKLTENSYRDVNIAFANELSIICNELGINVWDLIKLSNHHPRVDILQPGPGVGGHCIAIDPWFIVSSSPKSSKLIRTAREVNNAKPKWVLQKLKDVVKEVQSVKNLERNKISVSCFGLAFKADIDDLRESPSLEIATDIASMGFMKTMVVEPNIENLPRELSGLASLSTIEDALLESDIVVILVDHKEFKKDFLFDGVKAIIDTRGLLQ